MLNQRLAVCMAILALALALGCNAVYVTEPVGPAAVELKPEEWEGNWNFYGEGEDFHLAIADASEGRLNFATVEKSNNEFKLNKGALFVRPVGKDEWFLTAQDDDKGTTDPQRLVFMGLLRKTEDIAILWPVDVAAIISRVEAGKLPGKSDSDDAYLEKLSPAQLDAITTPPSMLLHWREPIPFIRSRNR